MSMAVVHGRDDALESYAIWEHELPNAFQNVLNWAQDHEDMALMHSVLSIRNHHPKVIMVLSSLIELAEQEAWRRSRGTELRDSSKAVHPRRMDVDERLTVDDQRVDAGGGVPGVVVDQLKARITDLDHLMQQRLERLSAVDGELRGIQDALESITRRLRR